MSSSDTQWFYECSCISWYWKIPLVKCFEEGRKTVEPVSWLSGSTDLTLVECERAETVTIFGSERSRQHVRVAKLCCVDLATCSLWASSPGRSGGGAWKGRRAFNYASGIWIPPSIPPPIPLWFPDSPSTELSDFRQSARSGNKHWKTRARGNASLRMSSPPISITHRLFRCR